VDSDITVLKNPPNQSTLQPPTSCLVIYDGVVGWLGCFTFASLCYLSLLCTLCSLVSDINCVKSCMKCVKASVKCEVFTGG
jgi:hypothetical protein